MPQWSFGFTGEVWSLVGGMGLSTCSGLDLVLGTGAHGPGAWQSFLRCLCCWGCRIELGGGAPSPSGRRAVRFRMTSRGGWCLSGAWEDRQAVGSRGGECERPRLWRQLVQLSVAHFTPQGMWWKHREESQTPGLEGTFQGHPLQSPCLLGLGLQRLSVKETAAPSSAWLWRWSCWKLQVVQGRDPRWWQVKQTSTLSQRPLQQVPASRSGWRGSHVPGNTHGIHRGKGISAHWTPALHRLCAKDLEVCLCRSSGRGRWSPPSEPWVPRSSGTLSDLPKVAHLGRRREGVKFSPVLPTELAPSHCTPSSSESRQHLAVRPLTLEGNGHPQELTFAVVKKGQFSHLNLLYLKVWNWYKKNWNCSKKETWNTVWRKGWWPPTTFFQVTELSFLYSWYCLVRTILCPIFSLSKLCHKHFLCCFKFPVNIWQCSLHQSQWVYLTSLLYWIFNSFPFFFSIQYFKHSLTDEGACSCCLWVYNDTHHLMPHMHQTEKRKARGTAKRILGAILTFSYLILSVILGGRHSSPHFTEGGTEAQEVKGPVFWDQPDSWVSASLGPCSSLQSAAR